jgi:hypothetical protein
LKVIFRKTERSGFWLEKAFRSHCKTLELEFSCKPSITEQQQETRNVYTFEPTNTKNVLVHYTPPDEYYQKKNYYCIGYYYFDSIYLEPSKNWKAYLTLMDEVWVPNRELLEALSKIIKKVFVVPILPILEKGGTQIDTVATHRPQHNYPNFSLSIKRYSSLLQFFRLLRMITRRKEKLSSFILQIELRLLKLLSKNTQAENIQSLYYTITDKEFIKSGLTVIIKEFSHIQEKELTIVVIHSSTTELLDICYEIGCLANKMKEKIFHVLVGEEHIYPLLKNGKRKNTLIYVPLFTGNYYYPYLAHIYKNNFIIPDHTAFKDIQTIHRVSTEPKFLDIKNLHTNYGYSNPINIPKSGWLKNALEKTCISTNAILQECDIHIQNQLKEAWRRVFL